MRAPQRTSPLAAVPGLDGEAGAEQRMGRERAADRDHSVEVVRLLGAAHRSRSRRRARRPTTSSPGVRSEVGHRRGQGPLPVAEVRAEGEDAVARRREQLLTGAPDGDGDVPERLRDRRLRLVHDDLGGLDPRVREAGPQQPLGQGLQQVDGLPADVVGEGAGRARRSAPSG